MDRITSEKGGLKRAIVVYDTKFGNTEKIAQSLEAGLKESSVQTFCSDAINVEPESLEEYDLIAVGAPTQMFSASKPMKEFLVKVNGSGVSGKFGFAFDTKYESRLSGSAAKYIEKELRNLGLEMIAPRESAIVVALSEGGGAARLKEREDIRFHEIGSQVGSALASRKMIPV